MKSVNRVTLLGNVTRDPELKSTTTGQPVCTMCLAKNRQWKEEQGEGASIPEEDKIAELEDVAAEEEAESDEEIIKGIEEGAEVDAFGITQKDEMEDSVSEESMEAA